MLVHADAVEAQRGGVFQKVHISIVDLVTFHRIEQPGVDVDPHRAVLLPEVVRQIRPRHQVEPGEFHRRAPFPGALRSFLGAILMNCQGLGNSHVRASVATGRDSATQRLESAAGCRILGSAPASIITHIHFAISSERRQRSRAAWRRAMKAALRQPCLWALRLPWARRRLCGCRCPAHAQHNCPSETPKGIPPPPAFRRRMARGFSGMVCRQVSMPAFYLCFGRVR